MWRSLVISWFVLMYWRSGIQAAQIQCNRPNEHFECGSSCQTTCAMLGTACPIVNIRCKDYCNENYARDANGTCIPEAQCPQNSTRTRRTRQVLQCNRPNEHYVHKQLVPRWAPRAPLSTFDAKMTVTVMRTMQETPTGPAYLKHNVHRNRQE